MRKKHTTRPGQSPDSLKAGNDCDASQTGLQEDRNPLMKAVQARCPRIAIAVWLGIREGSRTCRNDQDDAIGMCRRQRLI